MASKEKKQRRKKKKSVLKEFGKLHFGDNLEILRDIDEESVDLIYLDPPFNSKRSYNVLFKTKSDDAESAQFRAFEDSWTWGRDSARWFNELVMSGKPVGDVLSGLKGSIGANDMLAYLVMMAIRLVEMHKVLKPTGSIALHCDPTASHYLKLILDSIFGPLNFRNEIVWARASTKNKGSQHETRKL